MKELQVYYDIRDILFTNESDVFLLDDKKHIKVVKADLNISTYFDGYECEIIERWGTNFLFNQAFLLFDNQTKYIFNEENIFSELIISDTELLVKKIDFINEKVNYGIFNINNGKIHYFMIDRYDFIPVQSINSGIIISLNENILSAFSISESIIIWQYSFSELLQGQEIKQYGNIVVYKNRLFVYLSDNKDPKNAATISIDINTGKIFNVYQGFAGNLMLSNNKLYVASYETVKILNLINNEIIEIDFADILKPLALQIHWNTSVVQGDYLYFVDGHSYTTNKFGILDLKSRILVWYTEIKIDDDINNNIQCIKVVDDKLYVHCSDNSLHIFEIHKN